ncbi:hypothetical protein Leryth_009582 [Lithospermum erythrorhizon]|nr:hypothetical protein Leryth_009582 [Lithospermum erythrorhizon]
MQVQMFLSPNSTNFPSLSPNHVSINPSSPLLSYRAFNNKKNSYFPITSSFDYIKPMNSFALSSALPHSNIGAVDIGFDSSDLDRYADVGNKMADAAGQVIRKYFRKSFDILQKVDLSPVTIADQAAEEAMVKVIQESFPSYAIYGEENGWKCKEKYADYVWVLDPIDGTKSFITGKPLFGTLIALLYKDHGHHRSAYFGGEMDWIKREENCSKWPRSLNTQLCKTCTSLFVGLFSL